MCTPDDEDRVVPLDDLPQSSVGAPTPLLLRDEHTAVIAYYVEEGDKAWEGRTVNILDPANAAELVALVRFSLCYAVMSGPPNDEAFAGHPLAHRGLHPYGSFRIEESSWIRSLEQMNRVHPYHSPDRFNRWNHFVLTFHDTTFECIAEAYKVETLRASIDEAIPRMLSLLSRRDA